MVAVTVNVAVFPTHAVSSTGSAVITGGCPSFTVTVNVQVDVLPQTSVAVEVTVVTPTGNAKPEAGLLTTLTTPLQLSVAVTAAILGAGTVAAQLTVTAAGQVMDGACTSLTLTVKEQTAEGQLLLDAVTVTVVNPTLKNEPDPFPVPLPVVAPDKVYDKEGAGIPVTVVL